MIVKVRNIGEGTHLRTVGHSLAMQSASKTIPQNVSVPGIVLIPFHTLNVTAIASYKAITGTCNILSLVMRTIPY